MDEENKITTDVNQADETTASESSTDQETTSNDTENKTSDSDDVLLDGTLRDQKTVPYAKFTEVNEKFRATEQTVSELKSQIAELQKAQNQGNVDPKVQEQKEQAKAALKGLLEEMGYVSKDELRRREQDQALESDLRGLEKELDGKDGRPKFVRKDVIEYALKNGISNPKSAYELMNQPALINWHVQQAITKSKGLKTEASNSSGSANTGPSNDDLKAAAAKGDKAARITLMKRAIAGASKK